MIWPRKKPPLPELPDVAEARVLRVEAHAEFARAKRQAPAVAQLTQKLIERRALNHFGDALTITFTPKGAARG